MPVRYSAKDEYILLGCEGDFDLADLRAAAEEIAKNHSTKHLLRVLVVDVGSTFDPNPEELKALAIAMSDAYRGLSVRVAVHVEDELKFGKSRMLGGFWVGGGTDYEVFRDRLAAERWLLDKPYPPAN